jgi:LacI family transcriptional regulator
MATIYEVSELAGVSLATVSRVMNASGKVSARTRAKVEAAMKELGYRPNAIAQSLASNCTNSVGILVPELHGPFFGMMLSSIEDELRDAGKYAIITAGHSDEEREKESIEFLISRKCDALILHVYAVSDDYIAELNRGPVPIVVIGREPPDMQDHCISVDDEYGSYIATRALLELGHRDFAYISGPSWKSDSIQRMHGYRRALAEYGVEFDEARVVEGDYQEESGRQGMRRLLQLGMKFSALVCANDEMAAGAIVVARENKLVIPDDLSVMGFDNVFFTRYMYPALSTVNYPIDIMGRMAARCVLRDVYGIKGLEVQNRFELELVRRATTSEFL